MTPFALIFAFAALAAAQSPPPSSAPAAAPVEVAGPAAGGVVDMSLVEALSAIRQPQLTGLFSFVGTRSAPYAFADYVARNHKAMRRYLNKLKGDLRDGSGLPAWDHEVCATLVNLYESRPAGFEPPDPKHRQFINECVLAPVVPLSEIIARRRR